MRPILARTHRHRTAVSLLGRVRVAVGTSLVLLAMGACASASTDPQDPAAGAGTTSVVLERVAESPREDVPSALHDITDTDLPAPLVDPSSLVAGGPPPDGIPALDEPVFDRASAVTWLNDEEPVLSLEVAGETRAYPVRVMIWHEIVNDVVGGVPVAVSNSQDLWMGVSCDLLLAS